jgi:hypothetical protein
MMVRYKMRIKTIIMRCPRLIHQQPEQNNGGGNKYEGSCCNDDEEDKMMRVMIGRGYSE